MRRTWIIGVLLMLVIVCQGCAKKIYYPVVSSFIGNPEFFKYKKIAVFPFSDAPNSTNSGKIIQGLTAQIFSKYGFEVIEKRLSADSEIDDSRTLEIGRSLGVNAIVTGEVIQFKTLQKKGGTSYLPIYGIMVPIEGKEWQDNYVSLSFRVIDVETGKLIYSGSGNYERGLTDPPQKLAEYIISSILTNWLETPGKCGYQYEREDGTIIEIIKNSPAEKAGLKKKDRITKINGKDFTDITKESIFAQSKTFWGLPGEKIIIEVLREGENKKFEIIRAGKPLSSYSYNYEVEKPKPLGKKILYQSTPKDERLSPHSLGQRWAVIMGVSNYQDTRIPSLRYASTDAQAFYDWIVSSEGGKYAPSRVKLLIDQEATGSNIKNALFTWLTQAIAEDIVTIYFAGHGSPNNPNSPDNLFLYPYDTQYDNVAATGFPMWDIETALKRFIKAKKVIVVADACHAGGVGQPFDVAMRDVRGVGGIANPIATGLQSLSKVGDGICVISASGEKQLSKESQEWGGGHGVFTYFLLKGLKGEADYNQDERVTLGELIPFLSEQVRRETKNTQSPIVAGKFDPALGIGN